MDTASALKQLAEFIDNVDMALGCTDGDDIRASLEGATQDASRAYCVIKMRLQEMKLRLEDEIAAQANLRAQLSEAQARLAVAEENLADFRSVQTALSAATVSPAAQSAPAAPAAVKESLTTDSIVADAEGAPEIFPGTAEALNKLSVLPSKGQP